MKTLTPEKKTLRKMKREFDDFEKESRRSKAKKPQRGQKGFLITEEENFDED